MSCVPAGFRLALCLGGASAAQAQPTARQLGPPEAEFPEPFTTVTSLRELKDGRVLVSDRRDKVVKLLDFGSGKAVQVGREGSGPGEYALPVGLVALPGDTTLLYDPGNGRLLIIRPDGTPGGVLRLPEAVNPATLGAPRAADARGLFYYEVEAPGRPGARAAADRAYLLRYDRRTRRLDTLATLALPAGRFEGARSLPGGMLLNFTNKPLAPRDVAAYAPDGRVAVVRAKDYHVEWIAPSGAASAGPPVAFTPIRITEAEKKAFLDSQTRPGQIIVRGGGATGGVSVPIPGGAGGGSPFENEPVDWPEVKPPFLAGAAAVAPDGRLWVLKTRAHSDGFPVYDVIDGGGHVVERVTLPPRTRLAGFGREVVYLVRSDNDELQWLGRYRLSNP